MSGQIISEASVVAFAPRLARLMQERGLLLVPVFDAFFRDGVTALDAAEFLDSLTRWTMSTLDHLPEPSRLTGLVPGQRR